MVALSSSRRPSQLAEQVQSRFLESGHQPLRALRVEERHGQVTVSGCVPSFYMKQLAQTIASNVDGVHRVRNETTVEKSNADSMLVGV